MKKEVRTGMYDDELRLEAYYCYLRPLHEMIMKGMGDFGKMQHYGQLFECCIPE